MNPTVLYYLRNNREPQSYYFILKIMWRNGHFLTLTLACKRFQNEKASPLIHPKNYNIIINADSKKYI